MALDLFQNFVSVQYLGNEFIEIHQILYVDSYLQDVNLDGYTLFFQLVFNRVIAFDYE